MVMEALYRRAVGKCAGRTGGRGGAWRLLSKMGDNDFTGA